MPTTLFDEASLGPVKELVAAAQRIAKDIELAGGEPDFAQTHPASSGAQMAAALQGVTESAPEVPPAIWTIIVAATASKQGMRYNTEAAPVALEQQLREIWPEGHPYDLQLLTKACFER